MGFGGLQMEMALFQKQEAWEEAAEVCVQIGRSNWDWMKRNFLSFSGPEWSHAPGTEDCCYISVFGQMSNFSVYD